MKKTKIRSFYCLFFLYVAGTLSAQPAKQIFVNTNQYSSITQAVGPTNITISYYRSGVQGREILGKLIPYNQVWFAGSNDAVTFTCSKEIMISNKLLNAGKYFLFIIPSEKQWTILLNRDTDEKKTFGYDSATNVESFILTPEIAPFEEWLTYNFYDLSISSATVRLRWEKFSASFTITTDPDSIKKKLTDAIVKNQLSDIFKNYSSLVSDSELNPENTISTPHAMNQSETTGTGITLGSNETSPVLQMVEKDPIPVNTPDPLYPELYKKSGVEGTVSVKMFVTKKGNVEKAEIIKSDATLFDPAVLDAAMQWTFVPALRNNTPVGVWVAAKFTFKK